MYCKPEFKCLQKRINVFLELKSENNSQKFDYIFKIYSLLLVITD